MQHFFRCLCALLLLPITAIAAEKLEVSIGGIAGQFGYSETQLEIVMQDILNAKFKNFGVKVDLTLFPNVTKLDEAYSKGLIHGIFSDPLVVLRHEATLDKRKFLNLHYNRAPTREVLLVLVNKKSGITSLKELKNKKVTFYADNRLEQIYLETLLLKEKLGTIKTVFAKRNEVKDSQMALLDVFFGKSDVTIVPQYALETAGELNPQLKKGLVTIAKSDPMCTRIVMIRAEPSYHEIFSKFMAQGDFESGGGQNKLQLMKYEPTDFDALDSVRALVDEHKKLTK